MGTLYENIIHLCELRGIKGGKMCVDLGISKSLLSDLKAGRKKGIHMDTAEKIANYFDVPVGALLDESSAGQGDKLAEYDFMLRFGKLPFNERFQIENLVDLSAQHPEKAPAVLESAVYGFAETKKAPSEDGVMDSFTYAAHGYSGRLTDADKATIVKMMETLAAANEEDNGQADGGLSGSE